MPTERELRTSQEERLFDLLWATKLLEKGKVPNPVGQLKQLTKKAMSGMTAEEIDAIKIRVASAYADYYGEE